MPDMWKMAHGGVPLHIQDLKLVAKELLNATPHRVWLLKGEMGAGKTTLIKAICEELGVDSGMSSPTFSIVNQYTGAAREPIYHFDFYRLKNEAEALDIGVEEYLESGHYCFLEWPEKIVHLIPPDSFQVRITQDTNTTRKIEYFTND
jgi:tRNA threonylcarbamoyladenosine biosynthesis protein TsaE